LLDPNLLRTVNLTFTNANWATLLTSGRTTGTNTACTLTLENGVTVTNVGARYKGNSSFMMGGNKKSINLDINWADSDARAGLSGHQLNNAAATRRLCANRLSISCANIPLTPWRDGEVEYQRRLLGCLFAG
jgi:hypothetical protein